jgi:hypothetical protein
MGSLNRDTMARAYRQYRSRIEAIVDVDSNFIEQKSFITHYSFIFFLL